MKNQDEIEGLQKIADGWRANFLTLTKSPTLLKLALQCAEASGVERMALSTELRRRIEQEHSKAMAT